jgi:hypothetical protein
MTCGSCQCVEVSVPTRLSSSLLELSPVKSTEGMLRSQPGIHPVKVALLAERGVVNFDSQQWDTEKIIKVSPLVPCVL